MDGMMAGIVGGGEQQAWSSAAGTGAWGGGVTADGAVGFTAVGGADDGVTVAGGALGTGAGAGAGGVAVPAFSSCGSSVFCFCLKI